MKEKKTRSERMMDRSKKVLKKANIALDEGRMKKESRLLNRSEKIKRRSKRVLEREEYRKGKKAGFDRLGINRNLWPTMS